MEAVQDSPGVTLYDAHGALGIVAAHEAMVSAVKKARANGVAISFVRNSNHCGAMRFFTDMAAEEGMGSALPARMPPAPWRHLAAARRIWGPILWR